MAKIKVLSAFNHDELGELAKDDERDVTPQQAATLRLFDFVEFIETKPERAAKIETKPEPQGVRKHKGK